MSIAIAPMPYAMAVLGTMLEIAGFDKIAHFCYVISIIAAIYIASMIIAVKIKEVM